MTNLTPTGMFLWATFAAYALSVLLFSFTAFKRSARGTAGVAGVLGVACALNLGTLLARGRAAGHAPFQTNFEAVILTALCLSLGYIVIYLTNKLYAVGPYGQMVTASVGALTAAVAAAALIYAHGVRDAVRDLPPALQSPWFVPHVIVYIFGYGTLGVAFCSSVVYLVLKAARRLDDEAAVASGLGHVDTFTYRVIAVGFPFLSAGLIFGALWAQAVWATYWGWDSKEVWSLITWLVYLIYLHLRRVKGWRGARSAWFVILGAIAILITFQLFGYLPASATSVHKYG